MDLVPDASGVLTEYRPGTIRTFSGIYVDPLNLRVEDIRLVDICHSLANSGRYNGHYPVFRSTARHSIEVGEWVWEQTHDWQLTRTAMGHDFSEAYFGDMVNPLKRQPELQEYVDAEERAQKVISEALNLIYPFPEIVHLADKTNGEHERQLWYDGLADSMCPDEPERDEMELFYKFTELLGRP